jgi:hypothetical protein
MNENDNSGVSLARPKVERRSVLAAFPRRSVGTR